MLDSDRSVGVNWALIPDRQNDSDRRRAAFMAKSIQVDIVSAEGTIFSGLARMLIAPGIMGEVGVLPTHSPLLTRLKPGEIRIYPVEGEELLIYVSGGLLEIQPFAITVLADTALRAEDIDAKAALRAMQQAERVARDAEEAIGEREAVLGLIDYTKAKIELAKAAAQLKTLDNLRRRAGGRRGGGKR
jgi:F-type H+-transporting ATPase subunit epsilon